MVAVPERVERKQDGQRACGGASRKGVYRRSAEVKRVSPDEVAQMRTCVTEANHDDGRRPARLRLRLRVHVHVRGHLCLHTIPRRTAAPSSPDHSPEPIGECRSSSKGYGEVEDEPLAQLSCDGGDPVGRHLGSG